MRVVSSLPSSYETGTAPLQSEIDIFSFARPSQ